MADEHIDGVTNEAEDGARLGAGTIASLTGATGLGIFMVQNTEQVTVSYLVWEFTLALWLVVLIAALVGAVIWFGLGVMRRRRRRRQRRANR